MYTCKKMQMDQILILLLFLVSTEGKNILYLIIVWVFVVLYCISVLCKYCCDEYKISQKN